MRLHFYTRDLDKDYPNIGWLPPLPAGDDRLWLRFGNLHAGEYPEILLEQRSGKWNLYLSAMDSGRTDGGSGVGRVIRVSLCLSGHIGKDTGVVLGLMDQFLHETLLKNADSTRLKSIFHTKIKEGDPKNWTALPEEEQQRIANDLLADILKLPPQSEVDYNVSRPRCWMGGCAKNIRQFMASCQELLFGQADGVAVSLANLSASEAGRILEIVDVQPDERVAILLSTPEERSRPIEKVEKKNQLLKVQGDHQGEAKSVAGKEANPPGLKLIVGAGIAFVLIACLLGKCFVSHEDTAVPQGKNKVMQAPAGQGTSVEGPNDSGKADKKTPSPASK